MDRRFFVAAAVFALMFAHPVRLWAQDAVASPAIDPTIFKDGAVRAKEFKFDSWYARCQEIVKIKKRICNLLSPLTDASGSQVGSVIIATTDKGIPAVMVAAPNRIASNKTMYLETSHLSKVDGKVVKVEYKDNAKPMICEPDCKFMVPLDSRLVFTLNAGEDVKVNFAAGEVGSDGKKKDPAKEPGAVAYAISGHGFAETLAATTRDW